jgi:hypothetical protein
MPDSWQSLRLAVTAVAAKPACGRTQAYQRCDQALKAAGLPPPQAACLVQGASAWSPLAVFYTQATVPSWAPSDAPFVWDTSSSSVTLGWPEPAGNGGTVTGYEVTWEC